MFRLGFCISNPWSNRFKSLVNKSCLLLKNKAIDFSVYQTNSIIEVEVNITCRCDHAGVRIDLGLFGYMCSTVFYDTRHWDADNNKWVDYRR